jgi:glycosyltransferase involved in cell wall biosynthesis
MRIALVHPYLWPKVRRGGERYLDDLTWYLKGAGHDVDVITGAEPGPAEANGARVHEVRYPRSARFFPAGITSIDTFGLAALPRLARRYDVVHAFTPAGALAARAMRQRTLFTLLGHPAPEILESSSQRRLAARAVRRATVVAALSRASAELCLQTFGRRAEVLSPGVRLDRFDPRLDRRSGSPRILFPAAALPQKGLDVLLAAMALVVETMPDARLLIGGPGDPSWAFETLGAARTRVERAVDVIGVGAPEDLVKRYRDSTVTVLPSRDDAFGLVLIESLACGTPVVCCDAGGMPEIISDAGVGRVARVGDARSLADAIVEAIVLAGRQETHGLCRARAERWDWSRVIGPAHEQMYRRIAGRSI